jgi:hypothetical protein
MHTRSRLETSARAAATGRFALLGLACGILLGCGARRPPEDPPAPPAASAPEAGALEVTLSFGEAADLDRYVSDPQQETVYFGNTPTRSGGSPEADRLCKSPTPRVETVRFERPLPGRYRVDVDYPERCRAAREPIPFLVVIEADGLRHERRSQIALGRFLPVVVEFDVGRAGLKALDDD